MHNQTHRRERFTRAMLENMRANHPADPTNTPIVRSPEKTNPKSVQRGTSEDTIRRFLRNRSQGRRPDQDR